MANPEVSNAYRRRIVDDELDELLPYLPAISLDGAKGVGKTSTALARGGTVLSLDSAQVRRVLEADPDELTRADGLIVVDEWQHYPPSWDIVRRAVDDEGGRPGRFLLTGSASPATPPMHSGAGRIVDIRMRPLSLFERGLEAPTVSLRRLLGGDRGPVTGSTSIGLDTYVREIVHGGLPGLRTTTGRAQRAALDAYVRRIVDRDFPEAGLMVRKPDLLLRWLTAYAAATATTASHEAIRDAATAGEQAKPSRATTYPYRDTLERLRIADPLPAWWPTKNHLRRLTQSPKHHLADPALAAALLNVDGDALVGRSGSSPVPGHRDGTLLGSLFESLVTLDVRVYAQASEARVYHLRTMSDAREIDLVVEGRDRRVVAIEVKLSQTVRDDDVRHLRWLADQLGPDLLDAVVVTTGTYAYRRKDGVAVVPAALLGP